MSQKSMLGLWSKQGRHENCRGVHTILPKIDFFARKAVMHAKAATVIFFIELLILVVYWPSMAYHQCKCALPL